LGVRILWTSPTRLHALQLIPEIGDFVLVPGELLRQLPIVGLGSIARLPDVEDLRLRSLNALLRFES